MRSVNPASGEVLADYPEHDRRAIAAAIDTAAQAFPPWRERSFGERGAILLATAATLRRRRDALAGLITAEMGKPIAQAESEIEKCAWACEHFAAHAEHYLAAETVATDARLSQVRCEPLGPVLAVMPWNFPFWQVFRAAAPALMAGNVMLLKHASNVSGCAAAIERVFAESGAPTGVFTWLRVAATEVAAVVAHSAIRAVTLTGGEAAGMAVAAAAGLALKKCVLELGGSDPFVVLADADPEAVAAQAVTARTLNNGQSCIAAKRFIVEAPLAERFEWLFAQRMARRTVGDPADRRTELGPLARADLVEELERQVTASVALGARIVTGGARLPRAGWFYAPTVLADVGPGMPVFDQETFGPVATLTRAADADHAIALANHTGFGLGASLWTGDAARGELLAARIEAGAVFVNGIVKSDPRLPFGGVKRSGFGRELGTAGIREFVNLKTVWVA